MAEENIAPPRRNRRRVLTWREAIERRVGPPEKDALDWWRALGSYEPLEHDVVEKRMHLVVQGAVSPGRPPELFESYGDVRPCVRKCCEDLLHKYPRLTLFSPGISREQLAVSLAYALNRTWKEAERQLAATIVLPHLEYAWLARAEVWRGHYSPKEPAPEGAQILAPDETTMELVELLCRDPVAVRTNEDVTFMVMPYSPYLTDEQIDEAYRRAKAEAAKVVGKAGTRAVRRRPGEQKSYHAMVSYYQLWVAAGCPGTCDAPGDVEGITTRYARGLLKQAIIWLHPVD